MHESSCARVGAVPSSSSSRRHRRSRCAARSCRGVHRRERRWPVGATSAASTSTSEWRRVGGAEVAASLAHPAPSGASSSLSHRGRRARRRSVDVGSAADRSGRGLRSSQHRLDPARGAATIHWQETVVLGRRGEPSGSMGQRLRIDRSGRALLRSDLGVGPDRRLVLIGRPAGRDRASHVSSTWRRERRPGRSSRSPRARSTDRGRAIPSPPARRCGLRARPSSARSRGCTPFAAGRPAGDGEHGTRAWSIDR